MALAQGVDTATVYCEQDSACVTLLAVPRANGESLGAFYCGTALNVVEYTDTEWVNVYVVGSPDSRQGFMRKSDLSINSERDLPPAFPIVSANDACVVLDEPAETADALGTYLPGTLFKVIGSVDGWRYVRTGEVFGYIAESAWTETNLKVDQYERIPAMTEAKLDSKQDIIDMYAYPSSSADVTVSGSYQEYADAGITSVSVLALLDGWAQVEINYREYFIRTDSLLLEKEPQ